MRLLAALAPLLLAGCAASPVIEHITVDDSSASLRQRVAVLAERPAGARLVQPISARSCKRMAWDADASEADAVAQLQIKAARLNATALAGVACGPMTAATASPNCWQSIVCRAEALVQ